MLANRRSHVVCERCGEHFEPGDGSCLYCSQPESTFSEGCAYCCGAEPVLCEGHCVHCGREVLAGRAKLEESATSPAGNCWGRLQASPEGSQLGNQNLSDLTYGERFSVAWLLIWRGLIIAVPITLLTGLPVWISASSGRPALESLGAALIFLPALLLGVFVVLPWLVRTIVNKRFRSFSLVVVRKKEGSDT